MRTPKERINAISAATGYTRDMMFFEDISALAQEIERIASTAKLGWNILVNGLPGQNEWLEVSSYAPGNTSDVVVILKQALIDEYLGPIVDKFSISRNDLTQRITAIDAHMEKAMAAHNLCPK